MHISWLSIILCLAVFIIGPIVCVHFSKDKTQKRAVLIAFAVLFVVWLLFFIVVEVYLQYSIMPVLAIASVIVPVAVYFAIVRVKTPKVSSAQKAEVKQPVVKTVTWGEVIEQQEKRRDMPYKASEESSATAQKEATEMADLTPEGAYPLRPDEQIKEDVHPHKTPQEVEKEFTKLKESVAPEKPVVVDEKARTDELEKITADHLQQEQQREEPALGAVLVAESISVADFEGTIADQLGNEDAAETQTETPAMASDKAPETATEETPAASTHEALATTTDDALATAKDEAPAAPTDEAFATPKDEAPVTPTDEASVTPTGETSVALKDETPADTISSFFATPVNQPVAGAEEEPQEAEDTTQAAAPDEAEVVVVSQQKEAAQGEQAAAKVSYEALQQKADATAKRGIWSLAAVLYEQSAQHANTSDEKQSALFSAMSAYLKAKKHDEVKRLVEQLEVGGGLTPAQTLKLSAIKKMLL